MADHAVETCATGHARADRRRRPADGMPAMNGLELLAQMRRRGISTSVRILTGNNDGRTAGEALASGILAYVPKPFDFTRLEMLVALATSSRPISAATLGAPSRERQ
jgi:DNA-binding NtrC family response regulator